MKTHILLFTAAGLWLVAPAPGQTNKDVKAGGKAAAPVAKAAAATKEAEVRFVNGSTVFMTLLQEAIEVQTAFGKLTVPPRDIRAIEFGVHLPEGTEGKLEALLKQLGHNNYRLRDGAVKALAELGPYAYPALQRAALIKEQPEAAQRALAAIKLIERKVPARQLRLKEDDTIRTTKFTIVGRILNPTIKAKADYFGEVNLKPFQLHSIRCLEGAGEVEVVVDAAKHGSAPDQWLDVGFLVDPQLDLLITASGQVDLWPQGPGQYMAGPGGMAGGGGLRPVAGPGGVAAGPGQLVGRIGEDGPAFLIGDRYSGRPARVGKLYLHIGPSPWNNASTGSYRVKIVTGHNLADGGS
jgi:hypothetical protein